MADHKAEQILSAVITKVTSLTTTGTNVFRGRVYAVPDTNLPALCVFMGQDQIVGQWSHTHVDSELTIHIDVKVKESTAQLDTKLNLIRKEISIALQADITQGLLFVQDTQEGAAAEPDLSGEADKPIASQRLEWIFRYRRNRLDPST